MLQLLARRLLKVSCAGLERILKMPSIAVRPTGRRSSPGTIAVIGLALSTSAFTGVAHAQDTFYVANSGSNNILKFVGIASSSFASLAGGQPYGVALDSGGNVFVDYRSPYVIEKYTSAGVGSVFTSGAVSGNTTVDVPQGLVFDSTGNLFVVNAGNDSVYRFDSSASASLFASSNLGNPAGAAFDTTGNLYVASASGNTIYEFTPGATPTSVATPTLFASGTTNGDLNQPLGIAITGGYLYVTNGGDNTIEKYSLGGASLPTRGIGTQFAAGNVNGHLNQPFGIAYSSNSATFYVTNFNDSTLEKYDALTGVGTAVAGSFNAPTGIAVLASAPEPSALALTAPGVLLGLCGGWKRRRKNA
jgi:DNA-binding beta-propeller fold protein YncE